MRLPRRSDLQRLFKRPRVLERWSRGFAGDDDWVHKRIKVAVGWIDEGSKVLDLGCGLRHLEQHLPRRCTYTGADLAQMHPDNLQVDLDQTFVLPDRYDTVVLLGVLEFLERPLEALQRLQDHSSQVILSYVCRRGAINETIAKRRKAGAKNHWNEDELLRGLLGIGLVEEHRHVFSDRETDRHLILSLRWR